MTALARDRDERFPTARMLGEAVAAAVAPLSSAAISEELVHAFPVQLAEQAELIRVAREGGSLDLDVERGPSVGHGAELLTTPISQLLGMGNAAAGAPEPSRARASSPADAVPRPLSSPFVPSGAIRRLDGTPSVVALQPTPTPAPVPTPARASAGASRSWRPLAIAAIALGIGGAGAVVYSRVAGERARVASTAPANPNSNPNPDPGALPAAPTAPPATSPVGSAAQAPAPVAAAPAPAPAPEVMPQNAAPSVAAKAVEKRGSAATAPRPAAPARPSGPPGYITIDSSPMYATIYIDGKNYGETPVVKIELSPGRHVVHAVAPSGAARDVRIAIEAGKVSPAMKIAW